VYQAGQGEDISGTSCYDTIFSNSVLHWCKDKTAVFRQVAISLKKGGKFGFVIPNNFNIEEQFCTPSHMLSEECRQLIMNKTHVPNIDEIRNIISNTGFTTTYFQEHIREWKFEDVSKLVEFYMTHFNELGREHYNIEAMKTHYGEGEIIFRMPYTTVILVK
jgi:SAM-dependent methyltransferase